MVKNNNKKKKWCIKIDINYNTGHKVREIYNLKQENCGLLTLPSNKKIANSGITSLSDPTRQIPSSHISLTVKLHIAHTSQVPQLGNNHACIRAVLLFALLMPLIGTTMAHEAPSWPTATPWPCHTRGIYSVCKLHIGSTSCSTLIIFHFHTLLLSEIFLGRLLPCYAFASSSKLCIFTLAITAPLKLEPSPNPFYFPQGQMLKARKVFINWQNERRKQPLPLWSQCWQTDRERGSAATEQAAPFPQTPKIIFHHQQGQLQCVLNFWI